MTRLYIFYYFLGNYVVKRRQKSFWLILYKHMVFIFIVIGYVYRHTHTYTCMLLCVYVYNLMYVDIRDQTSYYFTFFRIWIWIWCLFKMYSRCLTLLQFLLYQKLFFCFYLPVSLPLTPTIQFLVCLSAHPPPNAYIVDYLDRVVYSSLCGFWRFIDDGWCRLFKCLWVNEDL